MLVLQTTVILHLLSLLLLLMMMLSISYSLHAGLGHWFVVVARTGAVFRVRVVGRAAYLKLV